MTSPRGVVAVISHPRSSLAAGLRAGLAERGWSTTGVEDAVLLEGSWLVVVLEDDEGRPLTLARHRLPRRRWIVIGSILHATQLEELAAQGALVVNQDVPFLVLLRRTDQTLTAIDADDPRPFVVAPSSIRRRSAEAATLRDLTERERAVLCGLVHGLDARRIADEGSRSVATVRSQIQSLMRRLGVKSQLQAVSVAHRAGLHAGVESCLDRLHQF